MAEEKWAGKDFVDLMTILSLDLMEAYDHIQTDWHHQPARRTWVRTFCSQLEAFVYSTKRILADFAPFPFVKLTPEDLAFLLEQPLPGKSKPYRLPLKENIKHMVATASRSMNFDYTLDTGDGWSAMMTTIKIRDRLVHPKVPADMIVTHDELTTVSKAQDWFHALTNELWAKMDQALRGKA